MENQLNNDKLEIIGRKRLAMSGVEAVDGFSEQVLNLTVLGNKVKITGEKIKITAFNKATGTLMADGVFNEIKYNAKKVPLLKRIFK
ncbi:MAG: YabP/YqfC family sporulation protein [Clostridia bacterium]|nr:YabP/YqfC family sporulation protein [Clostridia bacterium]